MEWRDGNLYEGAWSDDLVCPGLRGRIRGLGGAEACTAARARCASW